MVVLVGAGQAGDAPMFLLLLHHLPVARIGPRRPRTRPDPVAADEPHSSCAIRTHLRERGIGAVIPNPDDQKGHRKRRGSRGGRPSAFDAQRCRGRNIVERALIEDRQRRSLATRHHELVVYRAAAVLCAVTLALKRSGDIC